MKLQSKFAAVAIGALALTLNAGMADAKPGNKHGGAHCPPGLAKKNPPCVPPGLAKVGDYYGDYDHIWLDPDRHDLDGRYGWYKIGDDLVVRADKETGEILELFDAIIAVLD